MKRRSTGLVLAVALAAAPCAVVAQTGYAPIRIAPTPAPSIAPSLPAGPGVYPQAMPSPIGSLRPFELSLPLPATSPSGPVGGSNAAPVAPVPSMPYGPANANTATIDYPIPGYMRLVTICLTPQGKCSIPSLAPANQSCHCALPDGGTVQGSTVRVGQ